MARKRRKNRKRVSKDVPAKGTLRDMADRLWSLAVRDDWSHQCEVCGKTKTEAHHVICRQWYSLRWSIRNGIALCSGCHQFSAELSPHQNAVGWVLWLESNHPHLHSWYVGMMESGAFRQPVEAVNAGYLMAQIMRLRQYVPDEFEKVCGVKFSAWLLLNYEYK